ncbi:uncharacterized protein LOC131412973 [Diceros bicornis minor]|uniref:uncharacterized protein LOC131412973 n=1 Tax=Diceros bicornis minor TaxID=77932 RepID=UPI0026EB3F00|nr:uncharacterized protein LOC131412973 [Diceros bicornis minor]XP_058409246.1 uncharacterized protein LOC131412973 [Diceros bicornis minor]XP_058409247.1 uncharacterized protein LOC131412973 [Diceros bicornis minor]
MVYPKEHSSWRERSRKRSWSRTPFHLSEKDKMELLEIAKASAAKSLGIANLDLPVSLKTVPVAKERNCETAVPNTAKFESLDNENASEYNTNTSMTQTIPKKKTKRLCYFNVRWKDIYSWIREVNNPNRAYCTICRKEFGVGHGGEGDVKAHMETESHKSGMRQASTLESIQSVFVSQKDTNAQWKIAAAELAWAYHTNEHALSYRSLDCSMKLSKVTFPDSEVATKMSCGRTKGEILITDVLAPYSVELILSDLSSNHAFYGISSDVLNHGNKKVFPLALRYFDLKNGVSNRLLDFYEDFNETSENIKQKIMDMLSKYKLDFAHLSAYSADSADVNFSKFHSVYKLLTKENEKILPAECPAHLVHKTAKKGCDLLSCDIEAFIMKIFGYFSISSKHTEVLNEIFDFVEMEGDTLLRHMPTRWLSLLPAIEKMLKCWPTIKSYFQSVGKEECPSLIWKYIEDENGEKAYSTTEIYMLFLQNCLMVFEEAIRSLEKDKLSAPELFDIMCKLRQKLIQRKNDSFFGKKTALELKKTSPEKGNQIKQDFLNFFTRTITFLESNFDFTNSNYLCALKPFSLRKRGLTYNDIQCASECLKMMDILDMDNLYDEFIDAKDLIDKQLVYPNKPVDKKWMDIFGELEANSYKYKNLLLLISKILSIPCSNVFVERIFRLMSSHWTDTRNQCNVGLIRAQLQVKENFPFDCIQFYHYIKEKKDVLKAAGSSEKYYWKRKQKE